MVWQLAIVDFDGTLAESMPYWLELPFVTLEQEHIPEPPGFRDYIRSLPLWEVGAQMEKDYPFLLEKGPVTEQWYNRMEENYRRHVPLRPGALAFLALLRQRGLKIYLLSATRKRTLAIAMERFGFYELVDGVYSEEEVGSKRSESPYSRFAEETGIPLSDMFLVEDSWKNLRAAGNLGLGTVAIQDPSMAKWEAQLRSSDLYLTDFQNLTPVEDFLDRGNGGEKEC